jgi:hypothetical protein
MQQSSRCCVSNAVYGKSGRQSIKFEVGNAQAKCGYKVEVVTTVVTTLGLSISHFKLDALSAALAVDSITHTASA